MKTSLLILGSLVIVGSAACGGTTEGQSIPIAAPPAGASDAGTQIPLDASPIVPDAQSSACVGPPHVSDPSKDQGVTTPPAGALLYPTTYGELIGLTGNGYAIIADHAAHTLVAQSLGGGAPITILATEPGGGYAASVVHDVVSIVSYDSTSTDKSFGGLSVWTLSGGLVQLAASSPGDVLTNDDSSQVAFFANAYGSGQQHGDLVVAAADGSGKTTLRENVLIDGVAFRFVGASLVVSVGDYENGAFVDRPIDVYTAPTWNHTALPSGPVAHFDVSVSLGRVVALTSTHVLETLPLTGGPSTTIDTDVGAFVVSPDGRSIAYLNGAALRSTSLDAPSPITLAEPVSDLYAFSPNGAFVLFARYDGFDDPAGGTSDLHAIPFAGGPPLPLRSAVDVYARWERPSNVGSTADSSRAYFVTNDQSEEALRVTALQSGACPIALAYGGQSPKATTGAKLAFLMRAPVMVMGTSTLETWEMRVADTASSAPPISVVGGIYGAAAFTTARDRIVYSYLPQTAPGIYLAPLP